MHPLTLEFDDEKLEAEIKSRVFSLPWMRAAMVLSLLVLLTIELAGYGRSPLQYLVVLTMHWFGFAVIYFPGLIAVIMPGRMLANRMELHTSVCRLGLVAWLGCMSAWWYMVLTGVLPRIRRDDFSKTLACCALWVLTPVTMHVLHFPFLIRSTVLASAMPIIFSGDIAQMLLAALAGGELLGYILEDLIRSGFRERAEQFERLRQEKERAVYELLLTQHHHKAQARQQQPQRLEDTHHQHPQQKQQQHGGEEQSRQHAQETAPDDVLRKCLDDMPRLWAEPYANSIPESLLSSGTNSEIVGLFPDTVMSDQAYACSDACSSKAGAASGAEDAEAFSDDLCIVARGMSIRRRRVVAHMAETRESDAAPPILSAERTDALWRSLADAGITVRGDTNVE